MRASAESPARICFTRQHTIFMSIWPPVGWSGMRARRTCLLAELPAAGCRLILVRTGWGENSLGAYRHTWADVEPDDVAADLLEASRALMAMFTVEAQQQ